MKAIACGSPLPSRKDSRMTDLHVRESCWPANIMSKKLPSQTNFLFPMVWPLYYAKDIPNNHLPIPFCVPVRSWTLEGAKLWCLLNHKNELGQNQKGNGIKCGRPSSRLLGSSPYVSVKSRGRLEGSSGIGTKRNPKERPDQALLRDIQIPCSVYSSPRRSR